MFWRISSGTSGGHHALRHVRTTPPTDLETPKQRQEKENQADAFAAKFVKSYDYNIDTLIAFLREHPVDLDNRLRILQETLPDTEASS